MFKYNSSLKRRLYANRIPALVLAFFCAFYCFVALRITDGCWSAYERDYEEYDRSIFRHRFAYNVEPIIRKIDPSLVIIVASGPESFSRRQVIRETWGGYLQRDPNTTVIFFLGLVDINSETGKKIDEEAKAHGDILACNFKDSYFNISLKTYLLFDYALKRYASGRLFMKADEDIMLMTKNVLPYLKAADTSKATFFGNVLWHEKVVRPGLERQHCLPRRYYPHTYLPTFVGGPAYVGTRSAIETALMNVPKLKIYVHLGDVFFTGLAVKGSQVNYEHSFQWTHRSKEPIHQWDQRLSVHPVGSDDEMRENWKRYAGDERKE